MYGIAYFTKEIATSVTDGEDSATVVGARTIRREKLLLGISKITLILWAGGAPGNNQTKSPVFHPIFVFSVLSCELFKLTT